MRSLVRPVQVWVCSRLALGFVRAFFQDLICLYCVFFKRLKLKDSHDHAARLEEFYAPQAHAYDAFRSKFLWGREALMAELGRRLTEKQGGLGVWVDCGGGTGEGVATLARYVDVSRFKRIYIVDFCPSHCQQARLKVQQRGWANVAVVQGDVCAFVPPEPASLVTFAYSLAMIPRFIAALDHAVTYLHRAQGLLGVADFFVSGKWEAVPERQMSWGRRFFWRAVFDRDSVDCGPERLEWLEHHLLRDWELVSQGSIPMVPYLQAPWIAWVGRMRPHTCP